ncbi:IclR family transcriptional regulator [Mycetocola zhadangensis]|uniref:IclR family transcriptional regulator n=1 Tax=Mycetocola zhadangensis TaxID=1164595 RepID=A0A3L7IWJ0_9MICO|nr:IclR family transcriptional regulator [Mycetocola zhadangensis]RLQ82594.1 IclR family transcriptional regulator [Mycetocola zhadangensis]GGE99997.1 IclR family transcriptional regulator [Mycetocola zhadangensis]
MTPAPKARSARNTTTDRTLEILSLFSDTRLSISVADLVAELGVSRSSAYRYLQSLIRHQFLESAPDGSLRLGMRVLDLARLARVGYGISELAVPEMRSLAAEHRATVILTSLIGRSVVCLEREEWPGQFVRLSYAPGLELPVNAGASALVLLAWKSRADVEKLLDRPLTKFTTNTLTDVPEIFERLATIRDEGHAISFAEVDTAALGIAVPVRGPDDSVAAALSIVSLKTPVPDTQLTRALEDLHRAAGRISERLRRAA